MNLLQHIIVRVSMFEDAKKAIHQWYCFPLIFTSVQTSSSF